jgi:hypothetical protein
MNANSFILTIKTQIRICARNHRTEQIRTYILHSSYEYYSYPCSALCLQVFDSPLHRRPGLSVWGKPSGSPPRGLSTLVTARCRHLSRDWAMGQQQNGDRGSLKLPLVALKSPPYGLPLLHRLPSVWPPGEMRIFHALYFFIYLFIFTSLLIYFIYLSLYLIIHSFIWLHVYLYICWFIYIRIYLTVCVFNYFIMCLFICLFSCLFIYWCIYGLFNLAFNISVYLA